MSATEITAIATLVAMLTNLYIAIGNRRKLTASDGSSVAQVVEQTSATVEARKELTLAPAVETRIRTWSPGERHATTGHE